MNNYNESVALKVANMSISNVISIAMKNNRQDFSPQFSFAQTCLYPGSSETFVPGGGQFLPLSCSYGPDTSYKC